MHKERKDFNRASLLTTVKRVLSESVTDPSKKTPKYSLIDCLMSGIAIFGLKYPSLLQFQNDYRQEKIIRSNLKNLFDITNVPSDTQFRERLDVINYEEIQSVYNELIFTLQRGKVLEEFQYFSNTYLVAIDGTGYFASDCVHCANCSTQINSKTGEVKQYLHSMLSAVIVHPDQKCVFPIALEPINKNDGSTKNDCETNAAKRLLHKLKKSHPFLKLVITLDALYATGPMITLLNELNYEYVIVAKDTVYLQKHLSQQNTDNKKIRSGNTIKQYKFSQDLPLNCNYPDKKVNYIEYTEYVPDNLKKANFIIMPDIFSLFGNLKEYGAIAIINQEGEVYAHPYKELSTIIYSPKFSSIHNTIPQELKLDSKLSMVLKTAYDTNKEFYRSWYNMQNACNMVKKSQRISFRNKKGDILVAYDESLKSYTELLIPELRLIFRQHMHIGYYNTWITEIETTVENIDLLVKGGRSKWYIENQTFNTLKNQGYNFEHNFGHGYQYLSIVLCYLMFTAFMIDQIQEYCGYYFKKLLSILSGKKYIYGRIQGRFFNFIFSTWDELHEHILGSLTVNTS